MKLSGNTILITGGGTGIGLALAGAFAERGNTVAICGRRQEKLDEACRLYPGLRAYRCDVSDAGDRQRLLEAITRDGLSINVLVNNAACMRRYDFSALPAPSLEQVRRDIETNFMAPIEMIHLLLPMLRRGEAPTIVNVNSPGGVVPVAGVLVYCASKAALVSFSRSLRRQLAGEVRVLTLFPPSVETEMMERVELPKISVEKCCKEMMRRLAGDDDEIWIGQARLIPILARLMPRRILETVNKATKMT
jgi:uncharacterized oxidoreductase